MTRQLLALALVVALVASGVGSVAAMPTRMTIDADHGLTSSEKKTQFVQNGVATTVLDAPAISFTVAAEHDADACGIKGFHSDLRNDFLCVTYKEEIDRTIRVFIPNEYWSPYVRKAVEPVSGGVTASFEPVQNGEYTAVEFTITEPGTYAWAITKEASWFSGLKDRNIGRVENLTGVGTAEQQSWNYISTSELGGNQSAYVVRAPNGTKNLVMEFNTSDGWAAVPDERKEFAPVYYETKRGVDDRVYVFATTSAPPEVRYKTKTGARDQISAALREIGQAPARLEEILNIDIPFIGG